MMEPSAQMPAVADRARSFLVHATALFFAMCLSYALLDGAAGAIGAAAILALYVLGNGFRKSPRRNADDKAPGGPVVWIVLPLFLVSGFMAVTGATGTIVVAWLSAAYAPIEIDGQVLSPQEDIGGGLPHALTMLAGGVVFMALGVLLLNWGRGGLAVLAAKLRRHGAGLVLAPWLNETALLLLLTGGIGLLVASVPVATLVDAMTLGRAGGFLAAVELFPFLALGLAGLAVLAAASASLTHDFTLFEDMLRVLRGAEEPPPRCDPWLAALTTITLGGAATITGALLWGLHIGLLAAGASVPALLGVQATARALDDRAFEMLVNGRDTAAIAAAFNAGGVWRPDAPDEGLAALLPDLAAYLDEAGLQPGCRIVVTAAPATPEDDTRPIPEISGWSPGALAAGAGDDIERDASVGQEDFGPGPRPVRYCIRAACPVPTTWDAPDAVSLGSSHPSGRPEWMLNFYFDMFAGGSAPLPGGYCNADGTLAAEFRG